MRSISDLSRAQLATIVEVVQQSLYLDFDEQLSKVWNPDKAWVGAEVCDQLATKLAEYEIVPQRLIRLE